MYWYHNTALQFDTKVFRYYNDWTIGEHNMSLEWNADHLRSVRDIAEHKAQLIRELEAKPWRRSKEQNDMIDEYMQLSRYCQYVLDRHRL